jgi:FkbM family methyltransferase
VPQRLRRASCDQCEFVETRRVEREVVVVFPRGTLGASQTRAMPGDIPGRVTGGPQFMNRMRSLGSDIFRKLVADHPRTAFFHSAATMGIPSFSWRLKSDSPLFRSPGAETIELPVDQMIAPRVIDTGRWQNEAIDFLDAHLASGIPAVLFDVGANIGLVTRQLMHRLPAIEAAVCFEPHPVNYRLLEHNLAHLPNCKLVRAAIGDRTGCLDFYEDISNAGNYSLTKHAMDGSTFRTISVECIATSDEVLLSRLPPWAAQHAVIWKSDTQGFDELIATALPDSFWNRVQVGVMELWRIRKPDCDMARFREILNQFPVRRFSKEPTHNQSVDAILEYCSGRDNRHVDLCFARQPSRLLPS